MPWAFSTPCLKNIDIVLSSKPINFCNLHIYPHVYTSPNPDVFFQLGLCFK